MFLVDCVFVVIGFFHSLFYGVFSYEIFTYPHVDRKYRAHYRAKHSLKVHNFLINFIGIATGWVSAYILYIELVPTGLSSINLEEITLVHAFIFLIAMFGLLGMIPHAFWGLASSFSILTDRIFSRKSS